MISPENAALVLIDFQPAMFQGMQSHDRLAVVHNVQVLAKAAKLFNLPTVISTVAANSFSGPFMPEVTDLFPDTEIVDRTSINCGSTRISARRLKRPAEKNSFSPGCGRKRV